MLNMRPSLVVVVIVVSIGCFYTIISFNQFDIRNMPSQIFEMGPYSNSNAAVQLQTHCQMDSCFKYRNCPVFTNLSFKIHSSSSNSSDNELYAALLRSDRLVEENHPACITILVLNECGNILRQFKEDVLRVHGKVSETNLVIWLNFADDSDVLNCINEYHLITQENPNFLHGSIMINSFVTKTKYQYGYDIVPGFVGNRAEEVFSKAKARRNILAYFEETCSVHQNAMEMLFKEMAEMKNKDGNLISQFTCSMYNRCTKNRSNLCTSDEIAMENSVFTVLSLPQDTNILSTLALQRTLFHTLRLGSIPVVIGLRFILPYPDLIDWTKIVINVPAERILELPKILSSYSESTEEAMRINGRLVFNEYFGSMDKTVKAVLSSISSRLNPPGIHYVQETLKSSLVETKMVEVAYAESKGTRLLVTEQTIERSKWYIPEAQWSLTPSLWAQSFNNIETQLNSSTSLPISLGKEKFTIVMMTYNRVEELMKSLAHLNGLPKLDKIVIVWNSQDPPQQNLKWPTNMSVPIHVIKTQKNSLNNRFFPFDAIETDAVLNLDDDIYVSHENLLFAFRVWQENRNRLVGFPGRSVTMNPAEKRWHYDTKQYPVSLVLTGCTFLHKMYHVLYTFQMPKLIRNVVDKNMNCEDIAMNFLIAHHTQKPPIKVTSQVTFNCPKCGPTKDSLWRRPSHFTTRNSCIKEFSKIYGYLALFNTEYLAADMIPNKKERLS